MEKAKERVRLTTLKLAMVKVAEHVLNPPIQKLMQTKKLAINQNVEALNPTLNRHLRLIERQMGIARSSITRVSVGLEVSANSSM
jgi:hypothetical protein